MTAAAACCSSVVLPAAAAMSDDDEESSLDFSLRMKHGSEGSHDSFYMDFAKGIDSDIEAMSGSFRCRVAESEPGLTDSGETDDDERQDGEPTTERAEGAKGQRRHRGDDGRWTKLRPPLADERKTRSLRAPADVQEIDSGLLQLKPRPGVPLLAISQNGCLLSAQLQDVKETTSILETCRSARSFRDGATSSLNDKGAGSVSMNEVVIHRYGSEDFLRTEWDRKSRDTLVKVLSAIYGKLLVVMGMAFPMAEVISTQIAPSFYEAFYVYLYLGSIFFLLYVYIFIFGNKKLSPKFKKGTKIGYSQSSFSFQDDGELSTSGLNRKKRYEHWNQRFGSFYLKMGAVAFGVGSMIYSVLEFSQFFELEVSIDCYNILLAVSPASRVAFIFFQMYFIFLNSRVLILKYKNIARFGLMHMIAANLCVWLSVLVQESKHEILTLEYRPPEADAVSNVTDRLLQPPPRNLSFLESEHQVLKRSLYTPEYVYNCKRSNLLGELVKSASPFLFPCTIEYSLICAAILYVMWKNIGQNMKHEMDMQADRLFKRSRHHYSVDCAGAHKGLFLGILMLVLTSISLILFFVYIDRYSYYHTAVLMSQVSELILYAMSGLAIAVGFIRMRHMAFDAASNMELDSILLVISQTGLYIYTIFKVIGGYFMAERSSIIMLVTGLAMLLEGTMQTIFILHAIRRCVTTTRQYESKPGREAVTFLLVANLAMWAINTFETSRSNVHPLQLEFYGKLGWTIITHISMPLAIFYRFHSTVCLCEIWSRAYKMPSSSI